MSDQIRALQFKVERAEEHLAHLEDLLSGRSGPVHTPHVKRIHYHPERKTTQFETTVQEPPPEWAIVVGDIIHQLRSSLDHLICALALRGSEPSVCEKYKLSFPILKDPNDFKADRRVSQGHFERLIGIDELAEVERTQPYHRNPSSPTTDPLYLLSQLDNIDKHRAILVLKNRLGIMGSAASGLPTSKEAVKTGAERLRIDFPSAVPPYEVKMEDFYVQVVFAETGLCENVPVGDKTREMITSVEDIIEAFDRFF